MEKSETGGSDPCHPVAKHLAAEVCTGTLARFLRALGLRSLGCRTAHFRIPWYQEVGAQSDILRSHLRRARCGGALQKCIEDPLSEVLIQARINTRLAFIEVFLEYTKLYYRPLDSREARPCCCTRTRVCKFNWQRRSQSKVTNSTRRFGRVATTSTQSHRGEPLL